MDYMLLQYMCLEEYKAENGYLWFCCPNACWAIRCQQKVHLQYSYRSFIFWHESCVGHNLIFLFLCAEKKYTMQSIAAEKAHSMQPVNTNVAYYSYFKDTYLPVMRSHYRFLYAIFQNKWSIFNKIYRTKWIMDKIYSAVIFNSRFFHRF